MKTTINDSRGVVQENSGTGCVVEDAVTFNQAPTFGAALDLRGNGSLPVSGNVHAANWTVEAYEAMCVVSGAAAHVTATLPANPVEYESHTFIDASAAAATYNIVIVSSNNVNHPIVGHSTNARGIKLGKAGGTASVMYCNPFWVPTAISGAI